MLFPNALVSGRIPKLSNSCLNVSFSELFLLSVSCYFAESDYCHSQPDFIFLLSPRAFCVICLLSFGPTFSY